MKDYLMRIVPNSFNYTQTKQRLLKNFLTLMENRCNVMIWSSQDHMDKKGRRISNIDVNSYPF